MTVLSELQDMALGIASRVAMPKVAGIAFPPVSTGASPHGSEFMALALEGGAAGISYVSMPERDARDYNALRPDAFVGRRPEELVESFGGDDVVVNMLGLAAINAICQHLMRLCHSTSWDATDSLGLMAIEPGDRVGMVGFFPPLMKYLRQSGAEFVILENDLSLIERFPDLQMTRDVTVLQRCDKVLCTTTTLLNDTFELVLKNCGNARHLSVLGPTAGFFPDPLFARGVDVLGGRLVTDGRLLLKRVSEGQRWGEATRKLSFRASEYEGLDKLCSSIFSCS